MSKESKRVGKIEPEHNRYADFKPLPVDGPAMAFGAMGDGFRTLAPMYKGYHKNDVPQPFSRHDGTFWNRVVSQWFFKGADVRAFIPRAGIDRSAALAHLRCIIGSFEPDHQSKESIAAYLMWLWFEDYTGEVLGVAAA